MRATTLLSTLIALLYAAHAAAASAPATAYYIHAGLGADDNPGTRARPWKTLERASQTVLQPGDSLNFARGTHYVGTLLLGASGTQAAPIVVTAYGKGAAPRMANPFYSASQGHIIEITGRHVLVEKLLLHDTPTPPPDAQPTRWQDSPQHKNVTNLAAIFVAPSASNVLIRDNEFVNALVGVRLRGTHSVVTANYLHDAAKITEQWGAIAVSVVGPYNEVSYNLVENYGFYGGAYVNDGAVVELDGEDPAYNAHDVHIHHNESHNVKGGFVEIAGKSQAVLIDHNVSDDVDKFVGGSNVKGVEIRNNTVLRLRLPAFPKEAFFPLGTVFWSFNDKGDDEFTVERNVFVLDRLQRLYKSADHPLGIVPVRRGGNQYYSPNADAAMLLGLPMEGDHAAKAAAFVDPAAGDYRLRADTAASYAGAYAPGRPRWRAGIGARPVAGAGSY